MNDHDTLDFVHGQWSKLTNFDHLTTVILKFWLWSWSKIFDHLTGVGQMVKELWSSYPPPSLFRRLVSSNHSQPRPMAWRRYILPDPAKKKSLDNIQLTIIFYYCDIDTGLSRTNLHESLLVSLQPFSPIYAFLLPTLCHLSWHSRAKTAQG